MNITTLPLGYRPKRPFRILFTPFIASCLFHITGGDNQIFPVNIGGFRNKGLQPKDLDQLMSEYRVDLNQIGIAEPYLLFHDHEREFSDFLQWRIRIGIETGLYNYTKQVMCHCECGRVEIPLQTLIGIDAGDNAKIVQLGADGWHCSLCQSLLKEIEELTLVFRLHSHSRIHVTPSRLLPKVGAVLADIKERPLIVSRLHRTRTNEVTVGEFIIDPDHCWMHFLDYLKEAKGLNDFVIVVGLRHIPQAVRMISFIDIINPSIRAKLLITPLIDLGNSPLRIDDRTTTEELIALTGSKSATCIFLALQANWMREVVRINRDDLELIRKSLARRIVCPQGKDRLDIDLFTEYFNRESIIRILKEIRRRKPLTERDGAILSVLI